MADTKCSPMRVEQEPKYFGSKAQYVTYIATIFVATIALLATLVVNGLAAVGDRKFGFANSTVNVSNHYYTQVTPAGWTFSIWGVIYAWQCLWLLYGWGFVIRQKSSSTIPSVTYIFYTGSSLSNIIWSYLFSNYYPQVALAFISLLALFLYICIGIEAYNANQCRRKQLIGIMDSSATWVLVVNGLAIYATWLTVATLINFGIVLEYYGGLSSVNTGTLCLIILTIELLVYFILENTVLDRFVRNVFMVYPVIIWALTGILSAHWNQEDDNRNPIFTLILLILAIIVFFARIVLVATFTFFHKLKPSYKQFV